MTRVLTAMALIVVLLGVLWSPWQAFAAVAAVVALLAWREYVSLIARIGVQAAAAPGALLTLGLAGSFVASRADAPLSMLLVVLVLALLAAMRDHGAAPRELISSLAATLTGILWIGLLVGCQVGVRMAPDGATWLVLLYASVALGDAAAYYGGTWTGRHKLAPGLSPNKTVEGAGFGLAGSVTAALVMAPWLPGLSLATLAATGAVLGLVGQVGDLLESALKRTAGVKDSSGLLPGHGGVLDRIDAHLPAGGVLYVAIRAGWLG
jgi:phosphatidate cytidylyltransferase